MQSRRGSWAAACRVDAQVEVVEDHVADVGARQGREGHQGQRLMLEDAGVAEQAHAHQRRERVHLHPSTPVLALAGGCCPPGAPRHRLCRRVGTALLPLWAHQRERVDEVEAKGGEHGLVGEDDPRRGGNVQQAVGHGPGLLGGPHRAGLQAPAGRGHRPRGRRGRAPAAQQRLWGARRAARLRRLGAAGTDRVGRRWDRPGPLNGRRGCHSAATAAPGAQAGGPNVAATAGTARRGRQRGVGSRRWCRLRVRRLWGPSGPGQSGCFAPAALQSSEGQRSAGLERQGARESRASSLRKGRRCRARQGFCAPATALAQQLAPR